MKNCASPGKLLAFFVLLLVSTSCEKMVKDDLDDVRLRADGVGQGQGIQLDLPFYALADGIRLDAFAAQSLGEPVSSVAISGLQSGETILGIDFRPATGQLYGVGSTSRLYVINPATGAARAIGTGPFSPAVSGTLVGFDFNPTVDRIRLVTDAGQNLRLNPETGTVAATDGTLNGAAGARIAGAAYTNNMAGAATTTLYDLDTTTDMLYKQLPPNDGTLVEVGRLKLDISGEGGFDIAPQSNMALGLFEVNKKSTLFSVDLATGDTRVLYKFNKSMGYTGLAIATQPVAYAVNAANSLLIFNPEHPGSTVAKPIMGLAAGEQIVGLDFRPVNGQLYALSSNSRLFTLNAASGAAALVGSLSTPLAGNSFGVDFNPVVDRLRIVSNTGQNLRVNPADGVAIVDLALNPGMPMVTGAAYANNFAGTTATTLFDLDVTTDKLYKQLPPNNGTLVEVGSLGVDVEAATGFDIGGTSGKAYALLTTAGTTHLYHVNTDTGAAMALGTFPETAYGFTVGLGF